MDQKVFSGKTNIINLFSKAQGLVVPNIEKNVMIFLDDMAYEVNISLILPQIWPNFLQMRKQKFSGQTSISLF